MAAEKKTESKGSKPAPAVRLADEAVKRSQDAARAAEKAAKEAADQVAALDEAPLVQGRVVRAPEQVSGTAHGDGPDLVIESDEGGVRVTLGKESTLLGRKAATVARRKLDQASALL